MASTTATTAENNTLFEIDEELEAKFDAATQEQEQTGVISEDTLSLIHISEPTRPY